jgi:hypothetical protein
MGDQDIGSPGRPVSSGLGARGAGALCKNKTPLVTFPRRGVFPSKCSSIVPAEMSYTPR